MHYAISLGDHVIKRVARPGHQICPWQYNIASQTIQGGGVVRTARVDGRLHRHSKKQSGLSVVIEYVTKASKTAPLVASEDGRSDTGSSHRVLNQEPK